MKKEVYYKIIEVDNNQVLLKKSFDGLDTHHVTDTVVAETHINGMMAALTFGFDGEERRDEMFNNFSEEDARNFRLQMENLYNGK